jgi:membrane protein DedA with SNARE-associated domain
MVTIVRSLISIPAGIERMPMREFLLYTAAGSLIWNTALISAGYLLGEQWHLVERYVGIFQYIIVFAITVLVGVFIFKRLPKLGKK